MNIGREDTNRVTAAYVGAVRDHLGHVDAGELADLVEDLREYLDDVLVELGNDVTWDTLVARVGTPSEYAAELGAAAGIAGPGPAPVRTGFGRGLLRFLAAVFAGAAVTSAGIAVVGVLFVDADAIGWLVPSLISSVAAVACVLWLALRAEDRQAELRSIPGAVWALKVERWFQQKPWGEPTLEYVRSLRPAWWVARAAVLGAVVGFMSTLGLALAVFLMAVVGSVWLGRKTAAGQVRGGRLAAITVANAGVLAVGAYIAATLVGNWTVVPAAFVSYSIEDEGGYYDEGYYLEGEGLFHNGEFVENIFPYDADGNLLTGVRLYTHFGRPLNVSPRETCELDARPGVRFLERHPWGENAFPKATVRANDQGECPRPTLRTPFDGSIPDARGEAPRPIEQIIQDSVRNEPEPTAASTREDTPTPEAESTGFARRQVGPTMIMGDRWGDSHTDRP